MIKVMEKKGVGFIGLSYSKKMGAWQVHVDVEKWSHNYLKEYYKNMNKLRQILKDNNIDRVFGLCEDLKAVKFNKLFGAKLIEDVMVTDEDDKENYLVIWET